MVLSNNIATNYLVPTKNQAFLHIVSPFIFKTILQG